MHFKSPQGFDFGSVTHAFEKKYEGKVKFDKS